MTHRTCTIDGCDRALECKGMCHMHYVRTRPRTPDKPITVECVACGVSVQRLPGGYQYKYGYTCSKLCLSYVRRGDGVSVTLPSDHWARWYGRTSTWTPPTIRNAGACAWCGGDNDRSLQAAYCSPKCKVAQKRATRRGREYGAVGTYTWMDVTRLWQAFDQSCAYCRTLTSLADIQAEHVVPLSKGGSNSIANLLPSCAPCNSDKRDLHLHEWNADRKRRGLPPVRTTWNDADHRYMHLTSLRSHALVA